MRGDDRFVLVPGEVMESRSDACDVVVDFTSPEGTDRAARLAAQHAAALIVGTTGLSPENLRRLDELARSQAVLVAPNTAFGVALATRLAVAAAQILGPAWRVEIRERHHAEKRDAPSGTALRMAHAIGVEAGVEIPVERIASERVGDVVGEHRIFFISSAETLEIAHLANSRDLFARGAIEAAAWIDGREPGCYGIDDVYDFTAATDVAAATPPAQTASAGRFR
jgi:4-hydroxy-tetrahydrodipicolinate reductase